MTEGLQNLKILNINWPYPFRLLHKSIHNHGHVLQSEGSWFAESSIPEQMAFPHLRVPVTKPNLCDIQSGQMVPRG